MPLILKTNLIDLEVGDMINCEYTAAAGSAGVFDRLGYAAKAEIPVASTSTPNGSFNFICVDRKPGFGGICIADRNIQHSIAWTTLNNAGYIEGRRQLATQKMTSNTAPSGIVSASSYYDLSGTIYYPWYAFDQDEINNPWTTAAGIATGWMAYEFEVPKIIVEYAIKGHISGTYTNSNPKNWTFEGWDGNQWVVLDTRANITAWVADETKYFKFSNSTAYIKYRINITANNGWTTVCMYEFKMYEKVNKYIRSLTGGITYSDVNGNPVFTQPQTNYGAWPNENEWDKYILKSTLNGKVISNSNSVWNKDNLFSFCRETPVIGAHTSKYGTNGTPALSERVLRGFDARGISFESFSYGSTSSGTTLIGFRPVLIFKE